MSEDLRDIFVRLAALESRVKELELAVEELIEDNHELSRTLERERAAR